MTSSNKKPKWLAILLFVFSVLYLFPEIAFNAKLVEIAGGVDISDDQLHKTELFGRTISGIGVTILVADFLLKGWFTGTKLRALGSLVLVTLIVWPTVFFGQKVLIDRWLIEPSTPQQRQEAFFSSVLKSSLAMNAVNIEGVPYDSEQNTQPSEMTFLALIGGLIYSNNQFLLHIEDKKSQILERYIQNRANQNFEQHYDRYKDLRNEVQKAWKEYEGYVAKYNHALDSRHQRADKAWEEVETTIAQGYRDYQQAQNVYLARAEARAQKIAPSIYGLFDDQQRCYKRSGSSKTRCFTRIEERYERLLKDNAIPFTPMDYWLEIKYRRTQGQTSWRESLGTLGLSAVLAGLEQVAGDAGKVQEDRIYTNEVAHYTPRVLALWQDKFQKETGYPMGIESMSEFRQHPTTAANVRRKVAGQGITLAKGWQISHYSQFKAAVKEKVIHETKASWNAQAKQRSYDLAPNVSWNNFQQLAMIQNKIKAEMGERYYVEPMMANWNNKQFYQKVIEPNIRRERDYWLSYIEAARSQFADGGPFAERGKDALRSIIVPPISMGLSLFLVILTVFKLPSKFIALLNYDKPRPSRTAKTIMVNIASSVLILLVIFVAPVHFIASKYTHDDSTIGYFLQEVSKTLSPSGAYAIKWVIHTQPLIHPLGASIDQNMRITRGFSSTFEHMVDELDTAFSSYLGIQSASSRHESQKRDEALQDQVDSIKQDGVLKALPFTVTSNVETVPGYRVRIMNINPRYQKGMSLPLGHYDVEVTAQGYQPKRLWVKHQKGQNTHRIDLSKASG
ncbi:hypothetical protein ACPV5R_19445 [Vibrio astriarenae]